MGVIVVCVSVGGVKPYTHGNLVPLRRRGRLGEVCFLLDPENLSPSPSHSTRPLLFPSPSLFMGSVAGLGCGLLEGFSHLWVEAAGRRWRSNLAFIVHVQVHRKLEIGAIFYTHVDRRKETEDQLQFGRSFVSK